VLIPGGFNPVLELEGSYAMIRNGVPIARMPKDGFYFERVEKYPGAAHVDVDKWQPSVWSNEDLEWRASPIGVALQEH